jgi:hypothetical protein
MHGGSDRSALLTITARRPAPVFVEVPPPTDEGVQVVLRAHRTAVIHRCVPSLRSAAKAIHSGARPEPPESMHIGDSTTPEWISHLRDALDCLAAPRIRHPASRISVGFEADNHLRPSTLSNVERSQLKDAFGVVKTLQDGLAHRDWAP